MPLFEILEHALTEWIGDIARAAVPQPEPSPSPDVDDIITLFNPEDVRVHIKDFDASDQCRARGGYYRNGMLTIWFDAPNLVGNDGRVYILPVGVYDRFRYGGVGRLMRGLATYCNDMGEDELLGEARWADAPHGKAIICRFHRKDGKVSTMEVKSVGEDIPYQFQYGVNVRLSIPMP